MTRPSKTAAEDELIGADAAQLERHLLERLAELQAEAAPPGERSRASARAASRPAQTPDALLHALSGIAAEHGLHVYPVVTEDGMLIAQIGRFRRFSRLQEFCQAVRELAEQAHLSVHRVQGGWLEVRIGDAR